MTLILLFLRKHWPAIGAILVLAGVVTWTYFEGVSDGESDCTVKYERILRERETQESIRIANAMADATAQAKAAMAAERTHLQAQAKTDYRFGVLTNNVKGYTNAKPTMALCGLDADGLRYWNDANRSSAEATTSIPEAFLIPCGALPGITDGSLPTLLMNHVDVAHQYFLCAQRHADLVDVVRKSIGTGDNQ